MSSALRRLLVVLLMLALPLQGWAAAGMWVCAPLQDMAPRAEAAKVAAAPWTVVAVDLDDHCATAMHGMSGAPHTMQGDTGAHGASHAQSGAHGASHAQSGAHGASHAQTGAHGQCSVCALCTGAAMVSAPLLLDIETAQPVYGTAPLEPEAGFEQAGVERPPRR